MNMIKVILLLTSLMMLTACIGSSAPIPQDQFYRLSTLKYSGKSHTAIANVIAVSPLDSDVLHRERAILYSHRDEPLKLQRYHYHHWTHIPARLVQEGLIDYMRSSGLAREVIRYGEQVKIDAEIGGQLRRFEQLRGPGKTTVVVELELYYRSKQAKHVKVQKVYSHQVDAKNDSMYASVEAFSQALEYIAQEFTQDIIASSGL